MISFVANYLTNTRDNETNICLFVYVDVIDHNNDQ